MGDVQARPGGGAVVRVSALGGGGRSSLLIRLPQRNTLGPGAAPPSRMAHGRHGTHTGCAGPAMRPVGPTWRTGGPNEGGNTSTAGTPTQSVRRRAQRGIGQNHNSDGWAESSDRTWARKRSPRGVPGADVGPSVMSGAFGSRLIGSLGGHWVVGHVTAQVWPGSGQLRGRRRLH